MKRVTTKDGLIDCTEDHSLFDEKIGGNFIAKIDRIIEIIKTYSGKN